MTAEVKALIERFDHLRNSGVCSPTTRGLLDDAEALLAALSTPPADDVREALATDDEVSRFRAEYFKATKLREQVLDVIESAMGERFDIGHVGDAILAAFEVRPHRTVTDAEVEAGAWALLDRGMDLADRSPSQQVFDEAKADARAALEAAREARS